jgi:hypothetical protein
LIGARKHRQVLSIVLPVNTMPDGPPQDNLKIFKIMKYLLISLLNPVTLGYSQQIKRCSKIDGLERNQFQIAVSGPVAWCGTLPFG